MTTKPLIEVALKLTGQGFAPDDVTDFVGLAPTETWRLGEAIQRTQLKRKADGWLFGLPQRETYDMEAVLCELLDAVTPYEGRLAEAVEKLGLEVVISFGVYLSNETPACWFSANTLRRLYHLQASLDIDLILVE
jgi:hypothetical protein